MVISKSASNGVRGCRLGQLEDARFAGVLCGLKTSKQYVEVDPHWFSCCGEQLGFCWDEKRSGLKQCDVKERLRRVTSLLKDRHKQFKDGPEFLPGAVEKWADLSLEMLWPFFLKRRDGGLGWVQLSPTHVSTVSGKLAWAWALAWTWRLGGLAYVVHFPRYERLDDLISWLKEQRARGPTAREFKFPPLLVVSDVRDLTDPERAFAFEELIRFVYDSGWHMMVEIHSEPRSAGAEALASAAPPPAPHGATSRYGLSTKGFFSRKLKGLRAKEPLALVREDCLARLESMAAMYERAAKERDKYKHGSQVTQVPPLGGPSSI